MILADKITNLRKKNGWSQEELAEKMQVSRQAVSKWENAQTIPDYEKILALSKLFGVTTDYLLKDEIEDEKFITATPIKQISLSLANEFLEWRKKAALRIAIGTFLCIIAVIPLLILSAAAVEPEYSISENLAGGVGLVALLLFVAAAVALFVLCGLKNAPFEFIDKEPFALEYGVDEVIKEKQKEYRATYIKCNVIAAFLCVISPIPLFVGVIMDKEFFMVIMLAIMLFFVGLGVFLFVFSGVRFISMQKLLKGNESTQRNWKKIQGMRTVSTIYWLIITSVYLIWSFLTLNWEITWVVWPVAGILFAVFMRLYRLLMNQDIE